MESLKESSKDFFEESRRKCYIKPRGILEIRKVREKFPGKNLKEFLEISLAEFLKEFREVTYEGLS